MRIAPFAVLVRDRDDDAFVRAIVDASLVTHRDARSLMAAVFVGRAARFASFSSLPMDAGMMLRTLGDAAGSDVRVLADAIGPDLAGSEHLMDPVRLLEAISERADAGGDVEDCLEVVGRNVREALRADRLPTDGWALASPIASIVVSAFAPGLEAGLVTAVNLGGDADTVGAMVGGILGAAAGLEGLPPAMRRFPGYDVLVAWAAAAVDGTPVDELPDVLELERHLCEIADGAT
jgi:ADP-ribosyl-[dinitrogen reductase] hydrolase